MVKKKFELEELLDRLLSSIASNPTAQLVGLEMFLMMLDEANVLTKWEQPILWPGGTYKIGPIETGIPIPSFNIGSKLSALELAVGAAIVLSSFKPVESWKK